MRFLYQSSCTCVPITPRHASDFEMTCHGNEWFSLHVFLRVLNLNRCRLTRWTASRALCLTYRMAAGTLCSLKYASCIPQPRLSPTASCGTCTLWLYSNIRRCELFVCQVASLKLPRRKLEDLYEQVWHYMHLFNHKAYDVWISTQRFL